MSQETAVTILVTYAGDAGTRFDRDYYVKTHLPLALECWGPHGLLSATAFFPPVTGPGTIAIAELRFRDDAAVGASLAAPETARVMTDVPHYTDASPALLRAAPL
jgi:uncharacterized protein (TIGR02118 family)